MEFFTRKLVMQGQLNSGGSLFGGQCLSWIDEESAIVAISVLKSKSIVTKYMSKIDFKSPARLGDIVEIGTRVVKIGTTSITIACTIRNMTTEHEIVTVDEIVFVHLGEDGRPKAHGIPSTVINSKGQYADQHELTFSFCPEYGMGGTYYPDSQFIHDSYTDKKYENPYSFGWQASSLSCE